MRRIFTQALCLIACFIVNVQLSNAQCVAGSGQWPSGTVTLDAAGNVNNITTCNYADEYSHLTGVTSGETYEFTSLTATDFLTLRDGIDASSAVLASGVTPISWTATSGADIYLHVHADAACTDDGSICRTTTNQCTSCVPPPPPANDLCGDAIALNTGSSGGSGGTTSIAGTTTNATTTDQPLECGTTATAAGGVWYAVTVDDQLDAVFSLCGSTYDTKIFVYSGGVCGSLVCHDGNDDACSLQSEVTITAADLQGSFFNAPKDTESRSPVASKVAYVYVAGFSTNTGDFTLTVTQAPLPVKIGELRGEVMSDYNMIYWSTLAEINNDQQIVERFNEKTNQWIEVGRVNGEINSTEEKFYEMMDRTPTLESMYRIHSIDIDGYEEFSDVIVLKRDDLTGVTIAPNPFDHSTVMTITSDIDAPNRTINVYDIKGSLMKSVRLDIQAGVNNYDLDFSELESGIYIVQYDTGVTMKSFRVVKH